MASRLSSPSFPFLSQYTDRRIYSIMCLQCNSFHRLGWRNHIFGNPENTFIFTIRHIFPRKKGKILRNDAPFSLKCWSLVVLYFQQCFQFIEWFVLCKWFEKLPEKNRWKIFHKKYIQNFIFEQFSIENATVKNFTYLHISASETNDCHNHTINLARLFKQLEKTITTNFILRLRI